MNDIRGETSDAGALGVDIGHNIQDASHSVLFGSPKQGEGGAGASLARQKVQNGPENNKRRKGKVECYHEVALVIRSFRVQRSNDIKVHVFFYFLFFLVHSFIFVVFLRVIF